MYNNLCLDLQQKIKLFNYKCNMLEIGMFTLFDFNLKKILKK